MIPYGSLALFLTPGGKRYTRKVTEGQDWHSNDGCLKAADVHAASFGDIVMTSLGVPVRVHEATLEDRLMGLKRQTQIIYPKDVAYICLRLGAGPGRTILEAGCGSGGLTVALSWFCGPTGKVVSHDSREEFLKLARRNLDWANAVENVELIHRDIADGFAARDADAVFLDVREPWLYLEQVAQALKPGGTLGLILPTANQVAQLLLALERAPFGEVEVCELALRPWKPVPDRLRPADRMAAHTGFLMFCRLETPSPEFTAHVPRGTRERKQDAARQARESGQ